MSFLGEKHCNMFNANKEFVFVFVLNCLQIWWHIHTMNRCLTKIMCFQVLLIAVTRMDGLMTCCFTTFSAVFQSYQDDECVIMKGCVQWNPVYN